MVAIRHPFLLFVKFVQCRVVFDCSFHIVTLSWAVTVSHALSWIVTFVVYLKSVTLFDVSSHIVSCLRSWSRFVTHCHVSLPFFIVFKLVQCQVVFSCSFHVVTHCHALSIVIMNVILVFFYVCYSFLCFIIHGHIILMVGHALIYLCQLVFGCSFTLLCIVTRSHALPRIVCYDEWSLLDYGCHVSKKNLFMHLHMW
jgi:hypothetical protein